MVSRYVNLFGLLVLSLGISADTLRAATAASLWNRETGVHWSAVPLDEVLKRFGETPQLGIFLDRRIDPSRLIEFKASRQPLGVLLDDLAASLDLGCCRLDSVAYIGPRIAVEKFSNHLAERRPSIAASLRRRVPLDAPFLATPKELLERLARDNGFHWQNLDDLPHDLWPERKLPPTPLFELFALLLVGFDKTFELDEGTKTLRVVSLHASSPTSVLNAEAKLLRKETKSTSDVPLARRRFTLTIKEQNLDDVLRSLTERIGLKLDIDEASLTKKNVSLRQRISHEAKNATVQELFRGILSPLKLDFTLQGETIRIR